MRLTKFLTQISCLVLIGALAACDSTSVTSTTGSSTGASQPATASDSMVKAQSNGSLTLSSASYAVDEGAGSVTITVERATGTTGSVSVDYATADGTAVAGVNYTAQSGTLSWADGEAESKSVVVPLGAKAVAGAVNFKFALSQPSGGATLGSEPAGTVTISPAGTAQQKTVSFSEASYSAAQSAGSVTLTVNRNGPGRNEATVDYATSDGSALAGQNYTAKSGVLVWASGDDTAKTIVVPLSSTGFSGDRTFGITLSKPTGGVVLGAYATATVAINATPVTTGKEVLQLSATSYSVTQSAGSVSIPVTRTGSSSGAVTVRYATGDGSATAGSQYTTESGTLSWPSGDVTTKYISVPVSKKAFKGNLAFNLALSAPSGGAIVGANSTAMVTITGSAAPASGEAVTFTASSYTVSQTAGAVELIVSRTGSSAGATAVSYRTGNGSALSGQQYSAQSGTLTWSAGDSGQKTIVVSVSGSQPFSGDENFAVSLYSPTNGAALGAVARSVVTIHGSKAASSASNQSLSFATTSYSVPQSAGKVYLIVNRSGGSSGSVSVHYATADGSATAGQNYAPATGTLSWAAGDAAPKSLSVPLTSTVMSGSANFSVALSQPSGANLGNPGAATVTINSSGSTGSTPGTGTSGQLSIAVSGNKLVDGQGREVQLRGVNVSGLEGVAILGWSPSNPWGSQTGTATPDWNTMKTWGVNAVRLPLNEASWLGLSCVDVGGMGVTVTNGVKTQNAPGATVKADPGGNYQATVVSSVASAAAAGLYVILDLHLAAPGNACPNVQNAMADADHSVAFWTSVASTFKNSPNVIFELFNEPFLDMSSAVQNPSQAWPDLLNGGATLNAYIADIPNSPWQITPSHTWQTAGMQQMLDAVRATGANNVVLTSTLSYAGAIYNWLQYKPNDPAKQLGAVWHAYSVPQYPNQVDCVNMPGCSATIMASAIAIKAAGYPVVITEFGDTIGGSTSPWASVLLPFADLNDISYFGWAWDTWSGMSANVLITDAAGTPTQGYGTYVKAHYQCRAAGNVLCQ